MNFPNLRPVRSLLLAAALGAAPATLLAQDAGSAVRETLEQAREAGNRSVTVHVQGASLALLVSEVRGNEVIGRSAQHGRIVVRIDRIDAVSY